MWQKWYQHTCSRFFNYVASLALPLFLAPHALGDNRDPCEGVNCSGHGTCVVVEGGAFCLCDQGFGLHFHNLKCLPLSLVGEDREGKTVEDPKKTAAPKQEQKRRQEKRGGDACNGVTCSGHGTCKVLDDRPHCACEEGFGPDDSGINCLPLSLFKKTGTPANSVGRYKRLKSRYEQQSNDRRNRLYRTIRKAKGDQKAGIALLIVGGLTTITNAVVASKIDAPARYGAIVGAGIGGVFTLAGLVLVPDAAVRMKNARTRLGSRHESEPAPIASSVTPFQERESRLPAWNISYTFHF